MAIKVREIINIPVFALTGTNGKTSTRSMIAAVLNKKYNALSTKGNLNNHLGLPLSILRMEEKHNMAVLEMGTNHFGEIDFLCKIAKPNFGLITNIGRGHTEFLKSPAGVAKAKEELFLSIPQEGKIFINADDRYIPKMNFKAKDIIRYGFEAPDLNYRGEITNIDTFGRATISINNEIEIKVPVPGVYQAFNALAAATVGHHFGITYAQIKEALEKFQGVSNRFGIKNYRCTIIDDTYNANPESTLGAIETLAGIKTAGKKYFILGDMLELGDKKETYHGEMGKAVAATDIDYFFTQGELTLHAHAAALKSGHPKALHFDTKKEIIDQLNKQLKSQDIVLLKGSRGSKMEEIIEGIKE
jgi:UDP-N-acetylmuramoyl-tripeptide--D-alanyl-D-alanine ligase